MTGKVTVLGGGAMGTGCSILMSERFRSEGGQSEGGRPDAGRSEKAGLSVSLWLRNPVHAAEIARSRENRRLLPGVRIPDSIEITADAAAAIAGARLIVAAIPTAYLRQGLASLAAHIPQG